MRTLLALALIAAPALAEEPVSPSEFKDFAEGYTLYFERDGQPFGAEEFLEGGKTRWRYRDGSCVIGAWRPHGAQLCFLYPDQGSDVQCWRMMRDDNGLYARLLGPEGGLELRIAGRDRSPLLCGEPGEST